MSLFYETDEQKLLIDTEKCVGCGLCVSVCIRDNIVIENKKAVESFSNCFLCGHCLAVCPKSAIKLLHYSGFVPREYIPGSSVSSDSMMRFLSQRRSCRWFKSEKIPRDVFVKLFEAASYSPTAQNAQNTAFAVIDETLGEFMNLIGEIIGVLAGESFRIAQFCDYQKDPSKFRSHPLLWEGKQIICIFSEEPADAFIAAGRIETAAYSMGLGGFYSLFISKASRLNPEKLMSFFPEIPSQKKLQAVFVIGYPRIQFRRTVPREPPEIHWK